MTPLTPSTGIMSPRNIRHNSVAGGKTNPFKFGQQIFSDMKTERNIQEMEKSQMAKDAKGGNVDFKHH